MRISELTLELRKILGVGYCNRFNLPDILKYVLSPILF